MGKANLFVPYRSKVYMNSENSCCVKPIVVSSSAVEKRRRKLTLSADERLQGFGTKEIAIQLP